MLARLDAVDARKSLSDSSEKGTNEDQVNFIALKCLQQLLECSAPLNLFLVVDSVFSYIEKYHQYETTQLPISLVSFMMPLVATSYRHIIVNEVLRLLNECQTDKATCKNVALVKVLESCLNSPIPSIGISVLEYLNCFVGCLRATYHNNPTEQPSALEAELKSGLLSAITGLGTHLYYTEQINDILAFLVNKLQPNESSTPSPMPPFELELLRCMNNLVQTEGKSRNEVPFPILTPTLPFLSNDSFVVRSEYTHFLINSLSPNLHATSHKHSRSGSTVIADKALNLRFRLNLHQKLIDYGAREHITSADCTNILLIFKKLLDREAGDELIRALPIWFHIHQSSAEPGIMDQILLDYLLYAGDLLCIGGLSDYSSNLIQARKAEGLWFEGVASPQAWPTKQFASPEQIREILKHESQLKQLFPDLNERLDVVYEPALLEFIHSEPPKNKFVSKIKQPRLAAPIIRTFESKPVGRISPQVEQFKDALKVTSGSSLCEDDSDSSEIFTGSYSTVKRSKGSRTDLSALLKSISAHSLVSSASLVESPHRS
ncbi:hypothetical protein K493DRAFT_105863 [Basidiobolus meristosporus CBS 931.73]|uniref:Protein EFR3 n=1 Tax=Basidiobolus meristosporus CBS 931.73 TaxID=1314790 RepID=A0A1Y1WVN3_9FUNG|nr:hypothetical protein K493DRAFT_105863 [Basidiobolus meristosporus CBS 931.73]|eukprot:ORX77465.1 hypothetical protein K493DRAFT_105863 [Basidiobolus meristosporus CBS 931.73]